MNSVREQRRGTTRPMMNLSVTEISRITGLTVRALKYLEEVGLLDTPRIVGNSRTYLGVNLSKIETIAKLRHAGIEVADLAAAYESDDEEGVRQALTTAVKGRIARLAEDRKRLETVLETL